MLDAYGTALTRSLRACRLFRGMTDADLSKLTQQAAIERYQAGDILFRQDDAAQRFFVVLEGRVVLYLDGEGDPSGVARIGFSSCKLWEYAASLLKTCCASEIWQFYGSSPRMPKRTLEGAVGPPHGGDPRIAAADPALRAGKSAGAPARLSPADIETAARVALFSGLARASVADLLDHASVRPYDRDCLLFSAGDPADRFFVVVEGAVKLSVVDADGNETIIEIIGAGNSFAEAAMFGPGRFPVSGEAMAGARLITIEAATFLRKLEENRQLGLDMLAALGRWQLRLMAELKQLKAHTPAQRLGWYLLRLADGSTGPARIKLPYRKSIIAGRIGITPESMSRALARLAEFGVETRGDVVLIHDVRRLERFCQP